MKANHQRDRPSLDMVLHAVLGAAALVAFVTFLVLPDILAFVPA